MPLQYTIRRQFILLMSLALIPIAIGLFYAATMQRAARYVFLSSLDFSTVGTRHEVSYWGGDYQRVIRLWDSETGEQVADWTVPEETMNGIALSPTGDQFLRLRKLDDDAWNKVVVGAVAEGPSSETASFILQGGGGKRGLHWAEAGSKVIYEDEAGTFRCFDLDDGKHKVIRWERPADEQGYYWQSENNLIWYSTKLNIEESYQLVEDELVHFGAAAQVDSSNDFYRFFSNGTRLIVAKHNTDRKTCKVIDLNSGETITTIHSDGRPVSHWSAGRETVTCFYGDGKFDAGGAAKIVGAQVFDAQTGRLKHDTVFAVRPSAIRYLEHQNRYLVFKPNHEIESIDLKGRKTLLVPVPTRWWWPARALFIALAAAWWLTWSLTLRRDHRSVQPLIDIAILHAIVFVCSGVRLWAYVYGPEWSGYLHVWESVIFIGTGLSMITWFLLWVMFGPQRWSVRVSAFVFGVAVVLGVIVLIWDAANGARGYDTALALAQTMTGAMTQLTVQLGLLWLAYLVGLRLVHAVDPPATASLPAKRQTSIGDLFVWLVAFGVLFTVVKLRTIAIPEADNLAQIVTSGCVAGTVGVLTLWLGLGTGLYRIPIVLAGFAGAWWYYHHSGRMELMHVGSAWLPMLLASAAVLRWNGYALKRLPRMKASQSPK